MKLGPFNLQPKVGTVHFINWIPWSGVMDWSIGADSWSRVLEGNFGVEQKSMFVVVFFFRRFAGGSSPLCFSHRRCFSPDWGNFLPTPSFWFRWHCSQYHCVVSTIDFYITPKSRDAFDTHSGRHLNPTRCFVKHSCTTRINIVCKTTTSFIVRDRFGYNRVIFVCPSCGLR